MQNWTPSDELDAGPIYLGIASALSRDIEAGLLKPGDRLPPQRMLAERLSVDLTTVTRAYGEAQRRGLIESDGRRGSFVRALVRKNADTSDRPTMDTGMNQPPEPVNASLASRIAHGLAELAAMPDAFARFQYQPNGGAPADRIAAAGFFRSCGIDTSEDTAIITSGGQNALHAVVSAALQPGDIVATAAFIYPGFTAIARRYGLELASIASDEQGLVPDALEALCRARAVRAVYVVPTNDNPTTATMGTERRRAIADIADRHGLVVIEDDAYGQLAASPLPPITSFVPERGWYIASLSKIISPALRVAWLRAPSVKHGWRVATDIHETTIMPPPLNAALATGWLLDGSFHTLVEEMRAEARARQSIAADALKDLRFASQQEGYHIWLTPPEQVVIPDLINALRASGLSMVAADAFAVMPEARAHALRISIGGNLSRERLARALALLDALVDQDNRRKAPLI